MLRFASQNGASLNRIKILIFDFCFQNAPESIKIKVPFGLYSIYFEAEFWRKVCFLEESLRRTVVDSALAFVAKNLEGVFFYKTKFKGEVYIFLVLHETPAFCHSFLR